MTSRRFAVAALVLTACGGAGTSAVKPKQPAIDEHTAERGAKSLLDEVYQTIGRGDTDGVMTLLSDPLVVFGPRPTDVLPTRADALVALKRVVDPRSKRARTVHSSSLDVVASPGGHSAWAIDVIRVAGEPLAMTAVLSNADDIWLVSAVALAQMPTTKQVRMEAHKAAVLPPGAAGLPQIDPAARSAVSKFEHGLADPAVWGDDLARGTDAVVVGPALGEVARGKDAIAKLWKRRTKSHVRATAVGKITAETTRDGQLAWVTAPVVQFADREDPLPLRVFSVFAKHGGDWRMVSLQESTAFDHAGAGAAYQKIQAPPIVQPPAPSPKPVKHKRKKHGRRAHHSGHRAHD